MYQAPHARIHWYSALLSSATHFILSLDSDKLRTWQHAMCRPEHICDHSSPWSPAQLSSYLTLSDCCSFPALSFSTRQLYNSLCLQKYFMIDEKEFQIIAINRGNEKFVSDQHQHVSGNESWLRTRKQVYVIIFTVQRKQLAVCGAESADVESSFQFSNILTLCEAVAACKMFAVACKVIWSENFIIGQ